MTKRAKLVVAGLCAVVSMAGASVLIAAPAEAAASQAFACENQVCQSSQNCIYSPGWNCYVVGACFQEKCSPIE